MAAQFITKLMKSTILLYSFCFYTTPFDNLSVKYKTDLTKCLIEIMVVLLPRGISTEK